MKNDVDHGRIAGRKHPVPKPDPNQEEEDVPGSFFVIEFVAHPEKIFFSLW